MRVAQEDTTLAEEENILSIHWDEFTFGVIALAVLLYVFYRMWPRITKVLDERTESIDGRIKRAETLQAEAEETLQQYQAQLSEARSEAAQLRNNAKEQGAAIIAEMREEAQAEAQRIVANAHAQIEADRQQALVQLRTEIGQLSADLASRIVGETLQDQQAQSRVIDRFLAELEQQDSDQAEVR